MGKITIKLLTKQELVAKIYINAKERTCKNYAKYHSDLLLLQQFVHLSAALLSRLNLDLCSLHLVCM